MVARSPNAELGAFESTPLARYMSAHTARRGPIILATDGESQSGAVVVAARMLAARLDVPLEVVSVLEASADYLPGPEDVISIDPVVVDDVRRAARETLVSDYVARFSGGATPPRVHVRVGGVAGEVTRFAREVSATMIVVGSAPHRRFGQVVSGGRAAQILRSAPCPVLSVPRTFAELPRLAVAAVDFGPSSVRAAQAALLVVRPGGTVVLTHVLPSLARPAALSGPESTDDGVAVAEMFDRVREELGAHTAADVRIETRVITDDAVEGILSSADHLDAGVVAVGTHGPGLLARLLLGSVTETVLHRTERLVLASPAPPPGEALELWRRITGAAQTARETEWRAALDAFTQRNLGKPVMLEVDDPETSARVASHGYTLVGATYEPGAHRVEIMLGDATHPLHHVTRSITHPQTITMTAARGGGGEVLDIRHGRGHTVAVVADVSPGVAPA